jgi:hypothetical protein
MIWPRISAIGMVLLALQHLYGAASMSAYLLGRIASPFIPAWVFFFKPERESHTPREFIVSE